MSLRSRTAHLLLATLTAVLLLTTLGTSVQVSSAPSAEASTNEDGANWVPFIGDYELWCTSGNPGYSGCATHHNRPAMDIGMPVGVTIRAAGDGTVSSSGNQGDGRGTFVQITHAGGRTSHYYHLSEESVSNGQTVKTGDVIGKSGNTGSTTSPHLHYEEKNSSGATVEPGVMHSVQNGQLVDYPTAGGSSNWLQVPYGTRIINEGYEASLFSDVSPSTWNYAGIAWAVEKGIASGYPDGTWRNDDPVTRAQALNWIWKTAGQPAATTTAPHPDVSPTAWFRPALDWANEVPGMLDQFGTNFGETTALKRGQLAVLQWARAGKPVAPSAGFTDVTNPDQLAAANWMAARGYMTGYGDGTFRPANGTNRGQSVMALYRERLFVDVNATAWNRTAVDWARWRAYLGGYPDHTFRGTLSISRAQTVVMLWKEAGSPTATTSAGFTDVPPGSWYEAAADWAFENSVVSGYPDNTFRGDDPISRAQFVRMLHRMAGEPVAGSSHPFTDVPDGSWYDAAVDWAYENAIVVGVNGEFLGGQNINRGQSVNSFNVAANLPA